MSFTLTVRDGDKTATWPVESRAAALELAELAYPRFHMWEASQARVGDVHVCAWRDSTSRGRRIISLTEPVRGEPAALVVSSGGRR